MKNSLRVIGFAVVAIILYGCANTTESLKFETARSVGGNFAPEQVAVSDVDRGMTSVKWKAVAPNGTTYGCSADDMLHKVICVKK